MRGGRAWRVVRRMKAMIQKWVINVVNNLEPKQNNQPDSLSRRTAEGLARLVRMGGLRGEGAKAGLDLLLLLLLLLEDVLPRVVDGAVLGGLAALALGEDAGGDEDTDRKALGPHTGLDDLLGSALMTAEVRFVSTSSSAKQ